MISFLGNLYSKSIKINKIQPLDTNIDDKKICCICLLPLYDKKSIILEDCKHQYHIDCLNDWFKISTTCPSCRSNQLNAAILLYNIKKKKEETFFYKLSSIECFKKLTFK